MYGKSAEGRSTQKVFVASIITLPVPDQSQASVALQRHPKVMQSEEDTLETGHFSHHLLPPWGLKNQRGFDINQTRALLPYSFALLCCELVLCARGSQSVIPYQQHQHPPGTC